MINSLNEAMEQFRLISGKFYTQHEFESEDEALEFFKDDVNDLISLYYDTMVFVYNNPEIQDDCVEDLTVMVGMMEFVSDRIKEEMDTCNVDIFEYAHDRAINAFKECMERLNNIDTSVSYYGSMFGIIRLQFVFDYIEIYSFALSFDEAMLLFGKMVNIVSEMADNFEDWFWGTEPKSSFNYSDVVLVSNERCVFDNDWNGVYYEWDFTYNANKNLPFVILREDKPVIINVCVVEPDSQKALNPAQLFLTTSIEFMDLNEDVIISIIPVEEDLLPVEACTELLLGVNVDRGVLGGFVPIA